MAPKRTQRAASKPRKEKFIVFDGKQYLTALGRELKDAVDQIRQMMYQKARDYLKNVHMRSNPVVMADGTTTTDTDRKAAVLQSLIRERIQHIVGKSIRTTVSAMKTNFEDSHVGLYYEYGTGQKTDEEATYESLASPNWPYRYPNRQDPIVTRSRNFDHGFGKGIWMDVGGNLRKSNAPVPGLRSPKFIAYIGEDVEAEHWFSNAFRDVEKVYMDKYKEALAFIHPAKYMRLSGGGDFRRKGTYVLG